MIRLLGLLLILTSLPVTAAPPTSITDAFRQGSDFANGTLAAGAANTARTTAPSTVPGYAGTSVPETAYGSLGLGLTDRARAQIPYDPNAQWYDRTVFSHPRFVLDRSKDPIFKRTDRITSGAATGASSITGTYTGCTTTTKPGAATVTDFCTVWSQTANKTCRRDLVVDVTMKMTCTPGQTIASATASASTVSGFAPAIFDVLCSRDSTQIPIKVTTYVLGSGSILVPRERRLSMSTAPHGERLLTHAFWGSGMFLSTEQGGCDALSCTFILTVYSKFGYSPGYWDICDAFIFDVYVTGDWAAYAGYVRKTCFAHRYTFTFKRPFSAVVSSESWKNGCKQLMLRKDAGECRVITPETCVSGPATRTISGVPVTRPCWSYETTFECLTPNTVEEPYCTTLRNRGCVQTGSKCTRTLVGGMCAEFEQTYKCPTGPGGTVVDCGVETFCMDGSCVNTNYPPSTDFALAASYLSGVSELAQDFDRTTLVAFKGIDRRCKKTALGFRNCCKTTGWGLKLDLTKCSASERLLAKERMAGFCHFVGTYKKGKWFWKKKYASFCCFKSKLARIIQEQARLQLGLGWGPANAPNCRGLTLAELTSIDWQKMDLSEFYADVIAKTSATLPSPAKLNADIKARITNYLATVTKKKVP